MWGRGRPRPSGSRCPTVTRVVSGLFSEARSGCVYNPELTPDLVPRSSFDIFLAEREPIAHIFRPPHGPPESQSQRARVAHRSTHHSPTPIPRPTTRTGTLVFTSHCSRSVSLCTAADHFNAPTCGLSSRPPHWTHLQEEYQQLRLKRCHPCQGYACSPCTCSRARAE